jgi:DNA-directed RNA polymerase III subunit RPC6
MASSSSSNLLDIPALKTKIYDALLPPATLDPQHVFNQDYILALGIIPNGDLQVLLRVVQTMVNEKLFKLVQSDGLGWRLRTLDEAKKYTFLSNPG